MVTERKGGGARGQDLGKEERCDVYARHDLLGGLGAVTKHIYTLVLRVYMQHTPTKKTPERSHDKTHNTPSRKIWDGEKQRKTKSFLIEYGQWGGSS